MKLDGGLEPCFTIMIKIEKIKIAVGESAWDAKKDEKKRKRAADRERGKKGEKEIQRKRKKEKQNLKTSNKSKKCIKGVLILTFFASIFAPR